MGSAKGTFDPNGEGSSYYCFKRPRNSHSEVPPYPLPSPFLSPPPQGTLQLSKPALSQPKAAKQARASRRLAFALGASGGDTPGPVSELRPTFFLPWGVGERPRSSPGVSRGPIENRLYVCNASNSGKRSALARFSPRAHGLQYPQKDGPREAATSPRAFALGLTPGGGE